MPACRWWSPSPIPLLTRNLTRRNAHEPAVAALAGKRRTKNLFALSAMGLAITAAYLWPPLALALLVMPAAIYFLPDRLRG